MNNRRNISLLLILLVCEVASIIGQYVEFKTDFSNFEKTKQMDYSFRYYVDNAESGVTMDHWENRQGEKVSGGYGVLDPNGMVRTVLYEVSENSGFRSFMRMYPQKITPKESVGQQPREPIIHQSPVAFVTKQ